MLSIRKSTIDKFYSNRYSLRSSRNMISPWKGINKNTYNIFIRKSKNWDKIWWYFVNLMKSNKLYCQIIYWYFISWFFSCGTLTFLFLLAIKKFHPIIYIRGPNLLFAIDKNHFCWFFSHQRYLYCHWMLLMCFGPLIKYN